MIENGPVPLEDGKGPGVFETFLGVSAGAEDPLALLGLSPGDINEASVIGALQRQLTRVSASPDALTPEADEVRLALHAAAARLLDPTTRRRVLDQAGESAPAAQPDATAGAADMPVEAAMLMTMGAQGGWNRRSMHRMALVARSYGLAPEQTVRTIRGILNHPTPKAPAAPAPALRGPQAAPVTARAVPRIQTEAPTTIGAPDEPIAEELDPSRRIVRNLLLFGGAGLVGITAIVVLVIAMVVGNKPAPQPASSAPAPVAASTPTPEHQLFPAQPRPVTAAPKPLGVGQQRIGDWNDQLRAMSGCTAGLDIDASAAAGRFDTVYADMSRKWGEASPDGVVAGVDRIVEYLYHAVATPDAASHAMDTLVEGLSPLKPDAQLEGPQVATAAWSAGVLARLARERDLPASIRHRVQEALADAFPGSSGPSDTTFKSGAVAALTLMPARLAKPSGKPDAKQTDEAWKSWLAVLSALNGKQSPLFTRTSLVALEYLLIEAPEPTQDRAVFDAIGLLTVALPWRKDDESRRWLLRWFDSPGVTAGDLYAVTAALATQSGAEGVDSSMVLSIGAGESQRAELRDRYAAVWSLATGQSRDALVQEWGKAARAALAPVSPDPSAGSVDALERAVNLARLNQAAAMLWSGDTASVPDLLEPYKHLSPAPIPYGPQMNDWQTKTQMLGNTGGSFDAGWLVRYCGAGHNIPLRRELLTQMHRPPSPPEADILVEEACRGSPPAVRADARAVVVEFKNNACIINGMLDLAPMVPPTNENNELAEMICAVKLPNIKDPSWRVALRRALLERLTEVLAGEGELAKVEDFSEAIASAYAPAPARPLEGDPTGTQPAKLSLTPTPAQGPSAETAAMALRGKWQREAEVLVASGREPLNLAQIEARRSARLRLAVGRVQEFAGEQVAICELMSYVVTAEQPVKSDEAAAALGELADARRKSRHVFEQVEAGERSRLRFWLIRLGEAQS